MRVGYEKSNLNLVFIPPFLKSGPDGFLLGALCTVFVIMSFLTKSFDDVLSIPVGLTCHY